MQKKIMRSTIAALAMLASTAAWAGTEVHFNKPERFTDVAVDQQEREAILNNLAAHFEKLGESLKPGQTLKIDVNDVDLAGRENPSRHAGQDFRIMDGRVDWPRIRLHYSLEQDGKVISSGDATLTDMAFMSRSNRYPSNEALRYEKQLIDDWFSATFSAQEKKRPSRK